jgi:hypothetical protein
LTLGFSHEVTSLNDFDGNSLKWLVGQSAQCFGLNRCLGLLLAVEQSCYFIQAYLDDLCKKAGKFRFICIRI